VKVPSTKCWETMQKDTSARGGTIETFGFGFERRLAIASIGRSPRSSFVPPSLEGRTRRPDYGGQAGTERSLKTLTQHFVLGYFRWIPAGLIPSDLCNPDLRLLT
jgi:hypothetical protein